MPTKLSHAPSAAEWRRLHGYNLQEDHARRMTRSMLIVQLYERKPVIPVEKICSIFAISRSQVLRIVRLAGCEKRPRKFDPKIADTVLEMSRLEPRPPLKVIAAACKVSESYISLLEHANGITRYDRRKEMEIVLMSRQEPRPSLQEIADKFGVTKTWVSEVERNNGMGRQAHGYKARRTPK